MLGVPGVFVAGALRRGGGGGGWIGGGGGRSGWRQGHLTCLNYACRIKWTFFSFISYMQIEITKGTCVFDIITNPYDKSQNIILFRTKEVHGKSFEDI
jgi:hypothetical protein